MRTKAAHCVLCNRPRTGLLFCDVCRKSYDRSPDVDTGTDAGLITWAAKRTRRLLATKGR